MIPCTPGSAALVESLDRYRLTTLLACAAGFGGNRSACGAWHGALLQSRNDHVD